MDAYKIWMAATLLVVASFNAQAQTCDPCNGDMIVDGTSGLTVGTDDDEHLTFRTKGDDKLILSGKTLASQSAHAHILLPSNIDRVAICAGDDCTPAEGANCTFLTNDASSSIPGAVSCEAGNHQQGDFTIRATHPSAAIRLEGRTRIRPNNSGNNESINWDFKTDEIGPLSGPITLFNGLIKEGTLSLGCVLRVTEAVTGCSSTFTFGNASDPDLYSAAVSTTVGSTVTGLDYTADPVAFKTVNQAVRFQCDSGSFTGGKVRVTCFNMNYTAPTS